MKSGIQRKSRGRNGGASVPATAMAYNGPTRLFQPRGIPTDDSELVSLISSATLSSSAGGVLATVFDSDTQMNASADWVNYQNLYSEFRLLSMEIEFLPVSYVNTTGGIIRDAVYCVEDRQTATALASVANALGYTTTLQVHAGDKYFKCAMKMSGPGEATWISTGSAPTSTDRLYIKLYSIGNTASVTLFTYVTRMVVQVRNRK